MAPGSQRLLRHDDDVVARWSELTREMSWNRTTSVPLHARISQALVDLIESGKLAPGEKILPERDLAQLFGVSLAPVRQAILDVVNMGLIVRDRGRGTFVRGHALDEKVSILHSLSESMRDQHVEVETRILRQEKIPASREVAQALEIQGGEVIFIERVAIVGREPVALLEAYLAADSFADLAGTSFTNGSLYETLRERYGVVVNRAQSVIDIVRASSAEAEKLDVGVGEPLLRVNGIGLSALEAPVEYFRVLYRGDRVRFHVDSHRETDRVLQIVRGSDSEPDASAAQARPTEGMR